MNNIWQKFFFLPKIFIPNAFWEKCGLNIMNITVHLKLGYFGPLYPNGKWLLDSEMRHEKQIPLVFIYHWCNDQRQLKFLQNLSKLKWSIGNYTNMREFWNTVDRNQDQSHLHWCNNLSMWWADQAFPGSLLYNDLDMVINLSFLHLDLSLRMKYDFLCYEVSMPHLNA